MVSQCRGASWLHYNPVKRALSLNGVGAVEWKPCAQWSLPGQHPQPMSAAPRSVCFRKGHAIVIGRHHITDQRRTISTLGSGLEPKQRSPPKIQASGISSQSRVRFRSGALWRPERHGACLLPWSLLLYFCQLMARVILLVFLLVSAAIDDEKHFKCKWLWS